MKRLTLLFSVFVVLIVLLADLGRLPHFLRIIYDFPNGDKLGHFLIFGLLDFLMTLASCRSRPDRSPGLVALLIGLILAALITFEEYSQKYFANRTFDLVDLLASTLGLVVGGWIAVQVNKRRPS